jgi:hypothetical protein
MLFCTLALLLLELLHPGLPWQHPESPLIAILVRLRPPCVGRLLGAPYGLAAEDVDKAAIKVLLLASFLQADCGAAPEVQLTCRLRVSQFRSVPVILRPSVPRAFMWFAHALLSVNFCTRANLPPCP